MLYIYRIRDSRGDHVSGVVNATNAVNARFLLQKTYPDLTMWKHFTLKEADFNNNGVCEIHYG